MDSVHEYSEMYVDIIKHVEYVTKERKLLVIIEEEIDEHQNIITVSLKDMKIKMHFHKLYPCVAPIVKYENVIFEGKWDMTIDNHKKRLLAFFDSISYFVDGNPETAYKVAYGDSPELSFDIREETARLAGWKPYITNTPYNKDVTINKLITRSKEITAGAYDIGIAIFGLGSVGSAAAELLVRNGVGKLILIDIDIIEMHNVGRTTYTLSDVGKKKTVALIAKLLRINPYLGFELYDDDICSFPEKFIEIINKVHIVVVATDSIKANTNISRISYALEKFAIFIGMYDKGDGGEVVITNKRSKIPCYSCCTGRGTKDLSVKKPGIIYGTPGEKLHGVTALSADIVTVTSFAVKIITSLSVALTQKYNYQEPTELSTELKKFIVYILTTKLTYIRLSMTDTELISLNTAGSRTKRNMESDDFGEYSYKYLWTNPSIQNNVKLTQLTCNICGPNSIPIEQYDWTTIELNDIDKAIQEQSLK